VQRMPYGGNIDALWRFGLLNGGYMAALDTYTGTGREIGVVLEGAANGWVGQLQHCKGVAIVPEIKQ